MPKGHKTKSGSKKRFKITATGKVRFYRAGKKHILTKKKPKRRRHLRGGAIMRPGDARHAHDTMPHGGGV